jgi:hypothetical protein
MGSVLFTVESEQLGEAEIATTFGGKDEARFGAAARGVLAAM